MPWTQIYGPPQERRGPGSYQLIGDPYGGVAVNCTNATERRGTEVYYIARNVDISRSKDNHSEGSAKNAGLTRAAGIAK